MADITDSRHFVKQGASKMVVLRSGTTVTGGTDTLTMDLSDFGIATIDAVYACVHTTDNSVMVQESVTTAVAADTLTVTTAAGNNNKRRVVVVWGR